jgi:hypothetical protein
MATAPVLELKSADEQLPRQPLSREELMEILQAARQWYQATFPGRDLEAELIAERRAEAANE